MTDTEPAAPTDPTAPTDSTASPASATKEAIRAELEATRAQYRELLNSLSDEDWKQKSGNPSWNVRQLMWHMAWANGYTLNGVDSCRKGKGSNPPNWISDFGNTWITRIGARGATKQSVAEKYEGSHAKALAALETVQDDEWQKGARVFNQDITVESTFRSIPEHFKEHESDIKKGLGRA
ncbi:MAG: DinB family protein [Chloroflexi bacterium]|nr:MAG: DinB family protein [Chloroflexota bacterium]